MVRLAQDPLRDRYWLDRFPPSRRPSIRGTAATLHTDVAIVGGGAHRMRDGVRLCRRRNRRRAVRAGTDRAAQAARGTGIVVHEPEPDSSSSSRKQHGVRDARHIYQTARRGLARVHRPRCSACESSAAFRFATRIHFSSTPDGIQSASRRNTRRGATPASTSPSLKGHRRCSGRSARAASASSRTATPASIRTERRIGLARAAAARGAKIFEQSPVTRIRPLRERSKSRPKAGSSPRRRWSWRPAIPPTISSRCDAGSRACDGYVVLTPELPAAVRREMTPPVSFFANARRPIIGCTGSGNRVLFAGADQPNVPDRARERAHRAAHGTADVRAVSDAAGDFRPDAGILLGRRVTRGRSTACPITDRTATIRIITLRSAAGRGASACRSPRRGSSSGTTRDSPTKATSRSRLRGFANERRGRSAGVRSTSGRSGDWPRRHARQARGARPRRSGSAI